MKNRLQLMIVLGLAAAAVGLVASDVIPQSKSEDAAAVREAIRFEKAKDSASRRQLGIEASNPGQASEANHSEADRWTADRLTDNQVRSKGELPQNGRAPVGEAVRFEKSKDSAADGQMRLDARQTGKPSPFAAKTRKAKQ